MNFDIIYAMATSEQIKSRIKNLKREYEKLKGGKETLLNLLEETEIPESVYNSNSIENSTLTLKETEKILLEMEVDRTVSVREVFEAKNLARVIEYVRTKAIEEELNSEIILLLHKMLIGNINDDFAGRFREGGEYVRVAGHIGAPPEKVEGQISEIIAEFNSDHEIYPLDKISKFHLEFEKVHPFNDGNGRIGRVIINYQLKRLGFPPIIVRDKEKREYYSAFNEYNDNKLTKRMDKIISLGVLESLHKRTAYLRGDNIQKLSDYSKSRGLNVTALLNAAKRQTIPAFREKGVWKISSSFNEK